MVRLSGMIFIATLTSFFLACGGSSAKKPQPANPDYINNGNYANGYGDSNYQMQDVPCTQQSCPPVNITFQPVGGGGGGGLMGIINKEAQWTINAVSQSRRTISMSVVDGAPEGCTFAGGGANVSCGFNPNSTGSGTINVKARDITACNMELQKLQQSGSSQQFDCNDLTKQYSGDQTGTVSWNIVENQNGVDQNLMSQLNYKPKDQSMTYCMMGMLPALPGLLSGNMGGALGQGATGCIGGIMQGKQQQQQQQMMNQQMLYQQQMNQLNQQGPNGIYGGYNQQQSNGYYLNGAGEAANP